MPLLFDMPIEELPAYEGTNPRPDDFDEFWDSSLEDMRTVDPNLELIPAEFQTPYAECSHLHFTGVGGARVHAKLLRPRQVTEPHPAVLMFHGYSWNSGSWLDKLGYAAMGYTVAALDCRGQGGLSEDSGAVSGWTLRGHIVRGLDDQPEKLAYRQIFLDAAQLAMIVMDMSDVDETRVGATGRSQGGGLTLVCAGLKPRVQRAAPVFPFLSDYQRVWELDLAENAYGELDEYFRRFDPLHQRETEIFTKLGYVDVQNFAARIDSEVMMTVGLMDKICPPSTQFAMYNKISSKKSLRVYPDFGHENLPENDDAIFQFMIDLQSGRRSGVVYRQLGNSGVRVSVIGLGTNQFGGKVDQTGVNDIIDGALDLGINFIDTADVYSRGRSEETLGVALQGKWDRIVLGTKAGIAMGEGPNEWGASRSHIVDGVEASLRRLRTDHIDLFQIHRWDETTPIEETLRTLDDLVRQGKVRYAGASNFAAWQMARANTIAEWRGLCRFVTIQNHYHMLEREQEREMLPYCNARCMGFLPYFPLAGGFLTGKYKKGKVAPAGSRGVESAYVRKYMTDENYATVETLTDWAHERDRTMSELAHAWLLRQPQVSSVISGVTNLEQLQSNVHSASWQLSKADLDEVNGVLEEGGTKIT